MKAKMFSLLADLYSYPDDSFIDSFREISTLCPSLKKLYSTLSNLSLDEIVSHYIATFDVNRNGVKCVPYESYWYDRRLMSNRVVDVVDFYSKCGYTVNQDEIKLPPDHISIELAFISLLLEANQLKEAKLFCKIHLSWVEKFMTCLKNESVLYYELAQCIIKQTSEFLKEDT
ncbi:TorD/DmsD family molecular chaperone [Hippea jasoniae]|uniref:TorD/DmsD family molecular chaperone n=1 Tax=Hippea jasoniae TaxID=944479 RepID=UPI00054ECA2B|nr:molecular chaperone TorD family protein [Hippea jasoniae]